MLPPLVACLLCAVAAAAVIEEEVPNGCALTAVPSSTAHAGDITLHSARARVRELLAAAGAEHALRKDIVHDVSDTPLAFSGFQDSASGGGRVVWRGAPEGTSVVSGGVQVIGWQPTSLGGGAVFVASVPSGFAAGSSVRQLWVAGARASRTRLVNATAAFGASTAWVSADGAHAGYLFDAPLPSAWRANSTAAIEFVFPRAVQNWIAPRCTVAAISADGRNVSLAAPCGGFLADRYSKRATLLPPPLVVEAAPLFPLPPGTFFHDAADSLLYYALAAGQAPADLAADAWVAPAEVLVRYDNVSGHAWQGVAFTYGTWQQASAADGYVEVQSAVYACTPGASDCGPNVGTAALRTARERSGASAPVRLPTGSGEPPGNVRVAGCVDVSFTGCAFSHLGGVYALAVAGASHGVTVSHCAFSDLSGGFLRLGSVTGAGPAQPDPAQWDAQLVAADNTASDWGLEYAGAAGIFGGYLFSSTLEHNDISDGAYSGVSIGWGWGGAGLPGVGNNSVAGNRIARVMNSLADGGCIYVNGHTSATLRSSIQGNFCDADEAVYAVYYLDGGATNWDVEGNVASNSPLPWAFYLQGDPDCPAMDNHIADFFYQATLGPNPQASPSCNNTVDWATVYNVSGAWPPAAAAIIAGSGVRAPV